MVNADNTTKKQTEQSEGFRHFVDKSVLFLIFVVFLAKNYKPFWQLTDESQKLLNGLFQN